jgi:hypothetical protein
MTTKFKKRLLVILVANFILVLVILGYYSYWTALPPDRTCKSCHEIEASYNMWASSAHRDINCIECHGTALSNGIHSLKEKSRMLFRHYSREYYDDIALTEQQVIAMNQTCRMCHRAEYAAWLSGGHSVNYAHIFLDEEQNSKELLNHDCLRCHGMFHEGDIYSLVEPVSIIGPWSFKNPEMANQPVIPCLSCHQIHGDGIPKAGMVYAVSDDAHYERKPVYSKAGLYDRNERKFINADYLSKPIMRDRETEIKVSDDPLMRTCIQCHAPNSWHQSGSLDDRTPMGVHEGISCLSCHNTHSNSAVNACITCHPAISNCGLEVNTMNTTYAFKDSPNNIHFVSCADCHDGKRPDAR